ncbi:hypothetical protein [Polyangium sp. 15x6]|uniref:hypothetical protein n=1 Tax=Polyangium sp. 15x6 TaxID=3042687 RepID=UPI00249A0ECE|nr:hypothetical protein [Polyangium sp. 15x6]MDI3289338.1 hypothetical protein [Polyangium sp. 15x6]
MRYRIPLLGNPHMDVVLRDKYIAAFGSPCYLSVLPTFDCFYQEKEVKGKACDDAKRIAEVFGAAPYDKNHACELVAGTENYRLQVGSDVANEIFINYQDAPRQTPLVVVDGMPTEVSGPYRDLSDPADVAPGYKFDRNSGMVNADGGFLEQREWVLAVNRKKNGGMIRSDLAGFKFPCKKGEPAICTEPDFLEAPDSEEKSPFFADTVAQVHHVVPMKDKRCCPWGTNSYQNAAVISAKLNRFFTNNDPLEEEVKRLNNAAAYAP